ncbi:TetR/AcrR family transcriptional regulator [Actinoplanes sp. M2I2]|uniref:TetR/AcrR family transcriptional regulator n=1 Tax=Actinoplanes sp. M2I2 TaxID=1734444 RepID=UPI0020200E09|nr:TetR/AcrR family transcriptional regulator [Actinoplanes sp. M2I2]
MPRWEADGKQRLEDAALELFLEAGYDSTTVAGIAKRAGLTERSFYRHFTDKREVLFASGELLTEFLASRLSSAPPELEPFSALIHAMQGADEVFLPREYVQRRFDAISRSPALTERELVKLAGLADTLAQILEERGTEPQQARLATDLAMSVFRIASQNRQTTQKPFKDLIHDAVQAQRRAGLFE